jgi:hypothetical protein
MLSAQVLSFSQLGTISATLYGRFAPYSSTAVMHGLHVSNKVSWGVEQRGFTLCEEVVLEQRLLDHGGGHVLAVLQLVQLLQPARHLPGHSRQRRAQLEALHTL